MAPRLASARAERRVGEYERAIFAFKKGIEAQQRQSEVNLGRMQEEQLSAEQRNQPP